MGGDNNTAVSSPEGDELIEKNDATKSPTRFISQSSSMRERVLGDQDSSIIAHSMVSAAFQALRRDWHFKTYSKTLQAVITRHNTASSGDKNGGLMSSLIDAVKCGDMKNVAETDQNKVNNTYVVEGLITELLRFLAMKELLDEVDSDLLMEGRDDCDFSSEQHTRRQTDRGLTLELIPSEQVRDAWKALLFHPMTYSEVCAAMGCKSIIDYNERDADGSTIESTVTGTTNTSAYGVFTGKEIDEIMWMRNCYNWTLDCYLRLFNQNATDKFWPREDITETTAQSTRGLGSSENVFGSMIGDVRFNFWQDTK